MTHDDMIEVITAHRDGRDIEYRSINPNKHIQDGEWYPAQEGVDFVLPPNFSKYEYRVKREPREWHIAVRKDGGAVELLRGRCNSSWEAVTVREVIE